jgi:transposase
MIPVPNGLRVGLATGHTDMRRGFPGLALLVQETLKRDPFDGDLFVFRGRHGGVKIVWQMEKTPACSQEIGTGPLPLAFDRRRMATIRTTQMTYLLDGIDWRMPQKT